jgi:ABC-type glycerol-3-phosphate transport system permease component
MRNSRLSKTIIYALLVLGSVPFLVPLYQLLKGSLQVKERVYAYPPDPYPAKVTETALIEGAWSEVRVLSKPGVWEAGEPGHERDYLVKRLSDEQVFYVSAKDFREERELYIRWQNFTDAWHKAQVGRYLLNTLFVTLASVIGNVLSCSLVAYAFARLRFAGKNILFLILLATIMLPGQVTMIPTFMIFRTLGWFDTFNPLIIPAWFASAAFFVFLFRQYFLTIPYEIEEAARADGATPLAIYWHIMLPIAKPVVVTVAVYSFMGAWNDFMGPLIYINSDHKRTLALGLANFMGAYVTEEPALLMAVSLLMIVPTVILFFLAQRALMEGLKLGAVKG